MKVSESKTMRVTEGSIAQNYLYTVGKTRERIVKLQTQLASGVKVSKSSDDPQATDTILRLTESKNLREKYKNNASEGQGFADTTAVTLGQFADVLASLKDIVVRGSTADNPSDMATYGASVDQLLSEAVDIANTRFNGKFIFGGTQTMDAPYKLSAGRSAVEKNPKGIDGVIEYQVGENISNQINISGEQGLQGTQIFDIMIQLRDSFNNGTFQSAAFLPQVENALNHVLDQASYAGSFSEHFQAVTDNLDEQENQLTQYLSLVQDTDVAEATMKLKNEETMLDAALNTGARVIPKSLMDFLQ